MSLMVEGAVAIIALSMTWLQIIPRRLVIVWDKLLNVFHELVSLAQQVSTNCLA